MRLTLSVSYAVGVLLQIDQLAEDGPLTAARIARGCRFPPRFLYRVLRRLVDAGLLRGVSGPGGGYALAKEPDQITLLDIVSGVESAPSPTVLSSVCTRQKAAIALINQISQESATEFAAKLSEVTLADLATCEATPARPAKTPARSK